MLYPAQTTHFSFSESGDLSDHTRTEKALWRPKGNYVKECSIQILFQWNLSWLTDVRTRMGVSWDIPNMDCEPGKSKWLAKGNLEEIHQKSNSNCQEDATQCLALPPESSCVPIRTYCTLCPLNKFYLLHSFLSLCKFFSAKPKGWVFVTDRWSSG